MKYLAWSIIPIAIYVLYYFAMKKSLASHAAIPILPTYYQSRFGSRDKKR